MMLNADVRKGGGVGQMRTPAGRREGWYEKGSFFTDVLYERPPKHPLISAEFILGIMIVVYSGFQNGAQYSCKKIWCANISCTPRNLCLTYYCAQMIND